MTRRAGCKLTWYCFHNNPEDMKRWRKLKKHLTLLERAGVITLIGDILASEIMWEKRDKNLNDAEVILLLFSSDFLADEMLYAKVVRVAAARYRAGKARVFRIDLRPFYDAGLPEIVGLYQLPRLPKKWKNEDAKFAEVARQLHEAIEQESQQI